MTKASNFLTVLILSLLFLFLQITPIHASTFTVNSVIDAIDSVPGDGVCETSSGNGVCTLRASIMEANTYPGDDNIILPSDTFALTIPGSSDDNDTTQGDLDILDNVNIAGVGRLETIIDGNYLDRIFQINSSIVVFSNITLQNGKTNKAGGALYIESATVTLDNTHLKGNAATDSSGGAIYSLGRLTVKNSLFSDNKSTLFGGGGSGGAIYARPAYIHNSTFKNNSGSSASAIEIRGGEIINSTFSGNIGVASYDGRGCDGGAIAPHDFVIIKNTTITNNSNAGNKGGAFCNYGDASVSNTLISNNTPINCRNSTQSNFVHNFNESGSRNTPEENRNLDSDSSCFRDGGAYLEGVDAVLGPLADNGGLTPTHALLGGSPAIDSGSNLKCLSTDQRSFTRPKDGNGDNLDVCDIGAFEAQEPVINLPPTVDTNESYSVTEGGSVQVNATGSDPENSTLTYAWDLDDNGSFETSGQTITFSAASLNGPDSKTIHVLVTDSGNLTATDDATISIINAPPSVGPVTLSPSSVQKNTPVTTSASFTDPGALDSHTATWDWGDGNVTTGTVTKLNGSGLVSDNHTYTAAGNYTVTLKVIDSSGDFGQNTKNINVSNPSLVVLTPIADTYIKQGSQNENEGASTFLRIRQAGHNRALIQFNQSQIQAAITNPQNFTAKLSLAITDNGNNWGINGRAIGAYLLTRSWLEGDGFNDGNSPPYRGSGEGSTWNCAVDTNIANFSSNCSGSYSWNMNNPNLWPFVGAPISITTIINNQTGVVEFDVTTDVKSFVNNPSQNFGWIIKKVDESGNGQISFGSKESSNPPRLIITPQ